MLTLLNIHYQNFTVFLLTANQNKSYQVKSFSKTPQPIYASVISNMVNNSMQSQTIFQKNEKKIQQTIINQAAMLFL